jgi:signal transduction histidine kinase
MIHGVSPVQVVAESAAGRAWIRITDAGHGVDPSLVPRLFERFATGDRLAGTGLGLFIARELMKAQHGDAFYEEPTDQRPAGAFVVTIPTVGRLDDSATSSIA